MNKIPAKITGSSIIRSGDRHYRLTGFSRPEVYHVTDKKNDQLRGSPTGKQITSYNVQRCTPDGNVIPKVRMSKKTRLKFRKLAA